MFTSNCVLDGALPLSPTWIAWKKTIKSTLRLMVFFFFLRNWSNVQICSFFIINLFTFMRQSWTLILILLLDTGIGNNVYYVDNSEVKDKISNALI